MDEELNIIDEVFPSDGEIINDLPEDNVFEEPEDDPQIPTQDNTDGTPTDDTPTLPVEIIDEVLPDEGDVINPTEDVVLEEPETVAQEQEVEPVISNTASIPTIGHVREGDRLMVTLVNGEPTVLGTLGSGDEMHQRISVIEADYIKAEQLEAEQARITTLEAHDVDITGRMTAAEGNITNLTTNKADVTDLQAATADITNLKTSKADVSALNATNANVTSLQANKADINLANVTNSWINNGTIKNGAISNAMINDVSADKLTAGEIDASKIRVINLNADNLTVGTINGQRIGTQSISLDKLTDSVYTQTEVNGFVETLNNRIDGAIETYTGSVTPTLNNTPASAWTTTDLRDEHVGDLYYVVNASSPQGGFCYRFTKTGSNYSWELIKDSDVTSALQRLVEAEGDISALQTFETTTTQWMDDTDDELTSVKGRTTSLETRMGTAEGTLSNKVDTTTFNTLSQTVGQNSSSITTLTSKTDTLSNFNLSPYFSNKPYSQSNGYWPRWDAATTAAPYTWTDMGDGWMRIQCTNPSATTTVRRDFYPIKSPTVKAGQPYT